MDHLISNNAFYRKSPTRPGLSNIYNIQQILQYIRHLHLLADACIIRPVLSLRQEAGQVDEAVKELLRTVARSAALHLGLGPGAVNKTRDSHEKFQD